MPKDCAGCGAENVIQAKTCSECSRSFMRGASGSGGSMLGIVALVVVVAAAIWGCNAFLEGGPEASPETWAKTSCELAVEKLLAAPKTATYKHLYVEDRSDGVWDLRGTVESENLFGVPLRSTYWCETFKVDDDFWNATVTDLIEH